MIGIVIARRSALEPFRDRLDGSLGYASCPGGGRSARSMTDGGWHRISVSPSSGWYPMCEACWSANVPEARVVLAGWAIDRWESITEAVRSARRVELLRLVAAQP